MKTKIYKIMIVLMSFISTCATAQDAVTFILHSQKTVEIGSMEMTSTISIYDAAGNERRRSIRTAVREFEGGHYMLITFLSPADVQGTVLLIHDYTDKTDDMWIYLPALRKVRRIVSSERGRNFMGSEFTNADMSRPRITDFEYSFTGYSQVDQHRCRVISAKCKTITLAKEYGYHSALHHIDEKLQLTRKIEYFDADDKLQKVQYLEDYRRQRNQQYFAFSMTMQNVQTKRRSVMTVNEFKIGCDLPAAAFTPNTLNP